MPAREKSDGCSLWYGVQSYVKLHRCHESCSVLHPLCECGQKNKTNNESLKWPRSLTASEIIQTLKLKKETFRKSTAPVIYKHNGDRELLVGAGAKGRSKATSDLSVHTHTHTHQVETAASVCSYRTVSAVGSGEIKTFIYDAFTLFPIKHRDLRLSSASLLR